MGQFIDKIVECFQVLNNQPGGLKTFRESIIAESRGQYHRAGNSGGRRSATPKLRKQRSRTARSPRRRSIKARSASRRELSRRRFGLYLSQTGLAKPKLKAGSLGKGAASRKSRARRSKPTKVQASI
jgi:hypothetical protein